MVYWGGDKLSKWDRAKETEGPGLSKTAKLEIWLNSLAGNRMYTIQKVEEGKISYVYDVGSNSFAMTIDEADEKYDACVQAKAKVRLVKFCRYVSNDTVAVHSVIRANIS
jgi:hypothetical protein